MPDDSQIKNYKTLVKAINSNKVERVIAYFSTRNVSGKYQIKHDKYCSSMFNQFWQYPQNSPLGNVKE